MAGFAGTVIVVFLLALMCRISYIDIRDKRISKRENGLLLCLAVLYRIISIQPEILPEILAGESGLWGAVSLIFLTLLQGVWGGLVCAGIPELVNIFLYRGRGIGGGDIRLLFSLGFLLGADAGLRGLLAGLVLICVFFFMRTFFGKRAVMKERIPMGPFLCLGALLFFLL